MHWNEIEENWPELKKRIRTEHPDIDADALEKTEQGRRQLLQLLEAQYGLSQPVADDRVEELVGESTRARQTSDPDEPEKS